ncbi:hypothetical protein DFP72DRAFT_1077659 [Ephemerocybe angulata]|uniref:Uncharacterized protein n=1 Tax=Ephemerocybe angulata TaxID=980116 RepID=A0A8H6HFH0_9AGAR|nr:hypothetical protein DFP72DRAFT_1077659 [Tulosesus angulatus]
MSTFPVQCSRCNSFFDSKAHLETCITDTVAIEVDSRIQKLHLSRHADGFFKCPFKDMARVERADYFVNHVVLCSKTWRAKSGARPATPVSGTTPSYFPPPQTPSTGSSNASVPYSNRHSTNPAYNFSRPVPNPAPSPSLKRPAPEPLAGPSARRPSTDRSEDAIQWRWLMEVLNLQTKGAVCAGCYGLGNILEKDMGHHNNSCTISTPLRANGENPAFIAWRKQPIPPSIGICYTCCLPTRTTCLEWHPGDMGPGHCPYIDTSISTLFTLQKNTEFIKYLSSRLGPAVLEADYLAAYIKSQDPATRNDYPSALVLNELGRYYTARFTKRSVLPPHPYPANLQALV